MPPAIKSGQRRSAGKATPSKTLTRRPNATKRSPPKKKSPVKPSPSKTRSPAQSKSAPRKVVYRYYANIYRLRPYVIPGLKSARFLERTSGPHKYELGEEYQQLAIAHKLFDQLSNDKGYFVSVYDETRGFVFLYKYEPGIGVHFAAPSPVRNIRTLDEYELMYWYTEGDNRYVFRFGGDIEPYNSPAYKQTPTPEKLYFGHIERPKPENDIAQPPEMLIRASQVPAVVTRASQVPVTVTRTSATPAPAAAPSVAPRRGLFSWLFPNLYQ